MKSLGRLILGVAMCAGTLPCQTDTGSVTGTVVDPSRSAVAGARIALQNPATGRSIESKANASGAFTLPAVPPGSYSLTVSATGFEVQERTGVVVDIGSRIQADLTLQLAAHAEQVTVDAQAPPLETENSSVGQTIDNHNIENLPLNGRGYAQLAELVPGATHNYGSRAADGFSLNGARTFQNDFLVDGMDNNNYILGADTFSTQALHPSVDAIAEFRVETANYSAEFGRAQGGVIIVAIKSGTNAYHGTAFEFLRNDVFDANNFFSNRAGLPRPPLKQNQFGGTAGGPVTKNRLFFFTSYQSSLQNTSATITSTVPVAGEVNGNFGSIQIYNPATADAKGKRQQFPNNTIPASRIDPVGLALAKLYPAQNLPGAAANYASNIAVLNHGYEGDARLDYQVGARDSVFVRGSGEARSILQGPQFASPGNGGSTYAQYPFSQPIEAWSVTGNWTRILSANMVNEFRAGYTSIDSNQVALESQSLYPQFGIHGVPAYAGLTGLPEILVTGFADLGTRVFEPNAKSTGVWQVLDDLSWVRGAHVLKFGFETRRISNYANTSSTARGVFVFNGQFTAPVAGKGSGSAFADLLLGQPSNAQLSTFLQGTLDDVYYAGFVNDTWRLNSKVTVNAGLRYEIQTPLWEENNRQGNFDLNPASATYGTVVPATSGGISNRAFAHLETNNWAPRLGVAYQVAKGTVVRAAGGVFYGGLGYQSISQLGTANAPYFLSVTFPAPATAALPVVPLGVGFPDGAAMLKNVKNPAAVAIPLHYPLALTYQWNASIQRAIPHAVIVTATYLGSSTEHLTGSLDANDPVPGLGAINSRRPFPKVGLITVNAPFAHASYESLQAKAERRFTAGLSLLAAYTYAHALDNSVSNEDTGGGPNMPQDPRNTNAEKGSSDTDARHRFTGSGTWDLPWRRNVLVRDWQLGGILTAQTGLALTPTVVTNPAITESVARPNRICDGNASSPSIDRWYDVGCFPSAAPYTFGNAARGVVVGPGLLTLDSFVGREFRVREKLAIKFRAEAFNTLNRANFAPPVMTTDTANAGTISATVIPNRQMQFALRLVF